MQLEEYWSEVQHTMLAVAPLAEQNRMDLMDFYRQFYIWKRRAQEKVNSLQRKN